MDNKLLSSIFLLINLFTVNNIFVISKVESQNIIKDNFNLTTDYLKKIPNNDYIVGPGDTLKITISRDYPELDSEVTIDGEGTIYLPKIHRIFIKDLTLQEINILLDEAYKEYVKFPNVETLILRYRPIGVTLKGEVEKIGLINLSGSLNFSNNLQNKISTNNNNQINYAFPTLFDAIREADGLTEFSDLSNIEIIRVNSISNGGGFKKANLNLTENFSFDQKQNNIRIYDGDVIYIPKSTKKNIDSDIVKLLTSSLNPEFINVFINGRVKSPGPLKVSKASTLNDAILLSGGLRPLKGKIRLIRLQKDGTFQKRNIRYSLNNKRGSFSNPYLKNNDIVFINDSLLSTSNEVINEITGPFVGIFSTYGLIKALND